MTSIAHEIQVKWVSKTLGFIAAMHLLTIDCHVTVVDPELALPVDNLLTDDGETVDVTFHRPLGRWVRLT